MAHNRSGADGLGAILGSLNGTTSSVTPAVDTKANNAETTVVDMAVEAVRSQEPVEQEAVVEQEPVVIAEKNGTGTKKGKRSPAEPGVNVSFCLGTKQRDELKVHCVKCQVPMKKFIASAALDAMRGTYRCSGCKQSFTLRASDNGNPTKPKFCPVCGGSHLSIVR